MILATKKRLQLLFALGVAGANLTILALIFFYLHQSIFNGLVEHIADHAHNEFRDIYLERSLEDIGLVDEDEIFQVYSLQGQLVAQTLNSTNFHLALNRSLLQEAGQGKESFQKVVLDELEYIEYYFPLSEVHVGRLVESIPQLEQFETNMIRVVAFSLPGVLLLSIFLARWLVNLAMKPITLAYQYQDNFSSNLTHELKREFGSGIAQKPQPRRIPRRFAVESQRSRTNHRTAQRFASFGFEQLFAPEPGKKHPGFGVDDSRDFG